ncbi:MAG: T9SS type A sorting domain-containing protein, partial [Bacteroidota bacterium]
NNEEVTTYPNPFKGNSITLILPIMPQDGKIEVTFFNNLGQETLVTTAISTHPAHVIIYDNKLSALPTGMYYCQQE